MSATLVDMLRESVERSPKIEAVIQNDRRISYLALWQQVQSVARHLKKSGIERGDRVALLLENSPEYVSSFYGVLAAGGVAVPLNTQAKARDLANWIGHCDARWLIATSNHPELAGVRELHSLYQTIIVDRNGSHAASSNSDFGWDEVLQENANGMDVNSVLRSSDLAQIIYTSGTTGAAKGVTLSHGNLFANTKSILEYLNLTNRDRVMCVLPFYYSYGNSVLHTHLAVGATVILENSLMYPKVVLEKISTERATGFSGVPSTFALLLSRVKLSEFDLTSLRYLTQAGGAMAPAHIQRLRAELPHVALFVMYGQTEATARIAWLPPEKLGTKLGAVGVAIPGVTMELRDEAGNPVTQGQVGEIWVKGGNIMQGYWNNPKLTAQVLHDGWLKTGDLARQDEDGFFFIVGRSSDMIKTGAHRISPLEIEETLLELDGVAEAAVAGIQDEILGESIKAFLVLRPGRTLEVRAIQAHCLERLPQYKVPKQVEFVSELPRTASGKIKRFMLTGTSQ